MAYFRVAEARRAFQQSYPNRSMTASAAKDALQGETGRRGAARFDIFLSHSSDDAVMIAGVKTILENDGNRVYVDWMDDPQLDRSRVSAGTADLLRKRMRVSASLFYVSSKASPTSRWMPWELGYFDGMRPGRVAILPLVEVSSSSGCIRRSSATTLAVRSSGSPGPRPEASSSFGSDAPSSWQSAWASR